jgi:protein-S-isoprenylcysteine O-methyltransferase Ste14
VTVVVDVLVVLAWLSVVAHGLLHVARVAPHRAAAGAALLAALVVVGAALEHEAGRIVGSTALTLGGLALVAAGLGLHVRARNRLGPRWSARIAAPPPDLLVELGPYAVVRHPIYLAILVMGAGTALAHPSVTTLCALAGLTGGVGVKIALEERTLATALGPRWQAYCARVPCLVPSVLGRSRATPDRQR